MTDRLDVYCASCRIHLGTLTRAGWWWTGRPARLVNRSRCVAVLSRGPLGLFTDPPPQSTTDYRFQSVQSEYVEDADGHLVKTPPRVLERPYTCDSDDCMSALGPEWETASGPAFVVLPPAETAS